VSIRDAARPSSRRPSKLGCLLVTHARAGRTDGRSHTTTITSILLPRAAPRPPSVASVMLPRSVRHIMQRPRARGTAALIFRVRRPSGSARKHHCPPSYSPRARPVPAYLQTAITQWPAGGASPVGHRVLAARPRTAARPSDAPRVPPRHLDAPQLPAAGDDHE